MSRGDEGNSQIVAQRVVDLAGNVALEAAEDVLLGLADQLNSPLLYSPLPALPVVLHGLLLPRPDGTSRFTTDGWLELPPVCPGLTSTVRPASRPPVVAARAWTAPGVAGSPDGAFGRRVSRNPSSSTAALSPPITANSRPLPAAIHQHEANAQDRNRNLVCRRGCDLGGTSPAARPLAGRGRFQSSLDARLARESIDRARAPPSRRPRAPRPDFHSTTRRGRQLKSQGRTRTRQYSARADHHIARRLPQPHGRRIITFRRLIAGAPEQMIGAARNGDGGRADGPVCSAREQGWLVAVAWRHQTIRE